jgi:hypothetical protein
MPLALLTILGVRDIDLLLSLEPTAPAETWVFTELIDAAATAINVLLRNNPEAQFTLLMHQGRWKPVIERGKLNIYEQLARALCIAPAFEMGDYNPFPDYADSERGRARKRARISSDRSLSTAPQTRKEISPLAEVMRRIRFQSFDMRRHVVLEEQLWSTETQAMALTLELNEFFTL